MVRNGRLGDRIDIDIHASCRLHFHLAGASILHNGFDTIMRYEPTRFSILILLGEACEGVRYNGLVYGTLINSLHFSMVDESLTRLPQK